MIRVYFKKDATYESFDGGYYEYKLSIKVVRAKTYTKIVAYDTSLLGQSYTICKDHSKPPTIIYYEVEIVYKKKWRLDK